ncbi:UAP56-interacting factor isoform 3 [Mus musculus]|uniref:UAP56-interacting factor isoform 3 n=1 Tax=Mus musculus TaxID=10090 RepID=UPI00015482C5|nr:UAP56-interacting factor isoform 3 [Mus musculus]EDK97820.1 forty-two-three domain containing 1, isoform CRA_g [Mus musculus]|eukprot:XP_006522584.1 PREDICTED: UAP56-interacting factor isoform X1 [Mus musculus]
MNRFGTRLVGATATPPPPPKARSNENLDKIDMSLDDIIKLNRKEGKKQNFPRLNRRLQQSGTRQFRMRVRWGIQQNSGFGKTSLSRRGRVLPGKRRPYGVITGLAARKATGIRKGISPMNRPPLSDKNIERYFPALKRKTSLLRQNEVQRKQVAVLKRPNQLNRKNNIPANFTRNGNKLSHQKDTRQATFLFRRGLKVQTQLNTEQLIDDVVAKRTRQTQKPRLTRTAVPSFLTKREQSDVKKVPKGVPLQFDINSVGKQTGMTLNERFGILKEQRANLTFSKGGSRFVTVG